MEKTIHPKWSYNSTIYEINVRQFSERGDLRSVKDALPRLCELGVGAIWFMPIYPIGKINRKGTLGSYYSISDYTSVNPEFGTLEEFCEIVSLAHSMGMKILLDMVTNHTAWDSLWIEQGHDDWYVKDEKGNIVSPFDWSDTAKLDYNNSSMRQAMIDAMKFWIINADIDGFREDMAGLVPIDFWIEASRQLRTIKPDLFMLGEVEDPAYHIDNTFDATYAWEFHHLINRIASGENNADTLRWFLSQEQQKYPKEAMRLLFTSNHDENSWSGSEHQRMGSAAKCMAVLTYILNGIPLIYSGQEGGSSKKLEFFEKDLIDWSKIDEYSTFYRQLNILRKSNQAIFSGEMGGEVIDIDNSQPYNVYSIKRRVGGNIVIGLFNLTPYEVQPAFYDDDFSGKYYKLGYGEVGLFNSQYDPFGAWEYKIYWK